MSAPVARLPGVARRLSGVLEAVGGSWLPGSAPLPEVVTGVSIDTRTLLPGELFVAIHGERLDGHDYLAAARDRGAGAALVHRAVEAPGGLALVRVADTTRALADLARAARRAARLPVLVITGSVGKTTTKEIAASLLGTLGPVLKTEGNLNNRYGLPLTLLRLLPEQRAAVLELGMNHAGELRELARLAQPDVAVITSVAAVHLEFFDSLEAIAEAKAEVLEGLGPGGVAVLNADDEHLLRVGRRHAGRVIWFGRERSCEVSAGNWRGSLAGMRFDLRVGGRALDVALPLVGAHNLTNFLAAAAAAHAAGLAPEAIAAAASQVGPAPHRGEVRLLGAGVTLLDDCYNSNPAAVAAAVSALGLAAARRRVAVLGDMLELGPSGPELHRQAGRALAGRVELVVGVGALARDILAGAREAGLPEGALLAFPDAASAAAALPGLVQPGDAVLVKGSRGVRLEAVVEALVASLGAGAR